MMAETPSTSQALAGNEAVSVGVYLGGFSAKADWQACARHLAPSLEHYFVGRPEHRVRTTPAFCDVWTASQARGEVVPQHLTAARYEECLLFFHGRLFDRPQLLRETKLSSAVSDAGILRALYRRYGLGCISSLHGEWALAIIEPSKRRICLAADFSGTVPLYYSVTRDALHCSTELTVLAETLPVLTVNSSYLTGFILGHPELGETPYLEIESVIPGESLVIDATSRRKQIGWSPDLSARIRHHRDSDYEEQFRDIYWNVVGDRISPHEVVCAELSGGLDSSSVVAVAADVLQKRAGSAKGLCALHYRFSVGNTREDDFFFQAVVRSAGCSSVVVDAENVSILGAPGAAHPVVPGADAGLVPSIAAVMTERGARVLLSGEGGDNLMCVGSGWPCPLLGETLKSGNLGRLWDEALRFAKWTRRSVWDVLFNDLVRARRWKRDPFMAHVRPPWLVRKRVSEYNERARAGRSLPDMSRSSIGSAIAYIYVDIARRVVAAQFDRLTGVIDPSYPYLDRRLVEFMMAVPFHQKMRPDLGRWLQRRALAGVLPEAVRLRREKSSGVGPLTHAMNREWRTATALLTDNMLLPRYGFLDLNLFKKAVEEVRLGRPANLLSVWKALSVEAWLQGFSSTKVRGQSRQLGLE